MYTYLPRLQILSKHQVSRHPSCLARCPSLLFIWFTSSKFLHVKIQDVCRLWHAVSILSGNNDGKTDHPSVHSHSQAGVSTLAPAPAWPGPEYCITHQLDLARFSRHMKTNTIWYYGSWVSWGDRDCDHLCFYREGFNLWKNCVNLITNTTTTILNLFFQIVLSWLGAHFLVCLLLDEKSGEWVAMLASVVSSGGQRSVQFGFELLISCTSALWGVLYPPSAHQAIDRILLGALEILFLLTLIH